MKKVIIIIISILVIALISIIVVTHLGDSKTNYNTDNAKNILFINYDVETVNDIDVYFGEEIYYIANINKEDTEYISVQDTEYELVLMVEKDKIKNSKDITKNEAILGYKYEKLIYEVKEESKDGYNYIYYNALDGEQIKKIKINR